MPDEQPSQIVITDAPAETPRIGWWETAKRWIRTPAAIYLTALILLVNISQAWVAWEQRQTMQGQLDSMNKALPIYRDSADAAKKAADTAHSSLVLAQQSFKAQQRPYVWDQTPKFINDGPKPGTTIFANIYLANAGVTPALQLSSHSYVKFSEPTEADFETVRKLFKLPGNEKGGIVTPGNPLFITAVSGTKPTPFTVLPNQWNGTDPIFVYGRAEYTDVFGDSHWAEFCWHYLHPDNIFQSCGHHNSIDLLPIAAALK